ncbi:MAG: type I-E CRISPR-associated protein Cse1/CasA [Thermaceae bacterium]
MGALEKAFNLLDEPWIPVLGNGQVQFLGLKETLLRANEWEALEAASPLEEAALYRLLLAILHRALKGPKDTDDVVDLWKEERFPKEVEDYLERYRERFFLIHPEAPFFQIADLDDQKPLPWTKLVAERTSGNNPTLFDHSMDEDPPPIPLAEAARHLVTHQAFALGGLLRRMGVASGVDAPSARAAVFVVQGDTLFHTLLLNLVPYEPERDAPIWEKPPLKAEHVREYRTKWPLSGLTQVYTFPSRGVRLLPEGEGVRFIAYGPGVKPEEASFWDPMTARREKGKAVFLLRIKPERAFWRNWDALSAAHVEGSIHPPRVLEHASELAREFKVSTRLRVLGQATDQSKVLDLRREVYPIPEEGFSPRVLGWVGTAVRRAEEVGRALEVLGMSLAQEVFGASSKQEDRKRFLRSLPLLPIFWSKLDQTFPDYLRRISSDEESAFEFWVGMLKEAALEAWELTKHTLGTQARHLKLSAMGDQRMRRVIQHVGQSQKKTQVS